jgi:crotonobetainyl-CoA:carnitine CoA-transferase CaiB-like acyl-CoA transferase
MQSDTPLPLAGIQVLEVGGGAAAAYCGRLLADAGATVRCTALDESRRLVGVLRADTATELAYAGWLAAGKLLLPATADLAALSRQADLVILGEDAGADAEATWPRVASVDIRWFGHQGPLQHWRGSDLVVQALTGMPQMAGTVDGPPLAAGDRQATLLAGVTAYIAACAALIGDGGSQGQPAAAPRRMALSVLEANLVMAEMHMHFFERDGLPMRRCGINRFAPNSPVGIYPCQTGWVGITVATPDQWRGLCVALDLQAQARDEGLATRELRFARLDEVEAVLCQALARHSAEHWAAVGRQHRVPIVVVPDAEGILGHPIFAHRQSLATLQHGGQALQVPRTPFGLSATPVRSTLPSPVPAAAETAAAAPTASGDAPQAPPLQGITVVDFSMGWAGPLAARLLADLGAEVLKIEAGRYPDWWRGMNWTPEFIAGQDYERATIFCGMNRGKQGISIDLTTATGRALALRLVAQADAVVENQAAGVMAKFGLDHAALVQARPDLVMCSMSAFGTGNAWSDTRAYGSTLEQGSGLPGFTGLPGSAPTMTHLAHGDPVGGLYGCAAVLTGLVHRQRSGQGQYVNLSMVEAMLQLTTPGLLAHQVDPAAPLRRGNRRDSLAPHGFYPCAGCDQWLALAVDSGPAFGALCRLIGRPDWAADAALQTLAGRQAHEDAIDAAIAAWSHRHSPDQAAALLQAAGVMAAGLLHAEDLGRQPHLAAADFYIDLVRAVSGPQRQCGLAIRQNGRRLGARSPAPLLGEHSQAVLARHAGVGSAAFEALLAQGIVSLVPRPARNLVGAA